MKFFSAAIVAAVLCAAVSAAPTTPDLSFDELAMTPFSEIGDKLKDLWNDLKCMWGVVTKEVEGSKVLEEWEQTKKEIRELVKAEWGKCQKVSVPADQVKCKVEIMRKVWMLTHDFLVKVEKENKDLIERIIQKSKQCLKHDLFAAKNPLPDQFKCFVNALDKVSKANGLEDMWSKTAPQLQSHIDSWKQCSNAGSKLMVIICNIREALTSMKLMTDYIRDMAVANPKALQEFFREINATCKGQSNIEEEFDVMFEADEKNPLEKIKCIVDAIGAAIKESKLKGIYEEMKQDLMAVGERMKACQTEQGKEQVIKCVRKELGRAREIVVEFLRKLKDANANMLKRIRDNVKQKCLA